MPETVNEVYSRAIEAIARTSSREAFDSLFSFFAPRLKSYMMRLGASEAEAEELAQDVLVTVWRKADSFDANQANASTWIFRIARNRRIDAIRRDRPLPLFTDDTAFMPADLPHPEDHLNGRQIEACVREALLCLPEEQETLLRSAFFDGMTHSDIAEQTNLPLGTVKSRIRLAYAKLREKLRETG